MSSVSNLNDKTQINWPSTDMQQRELEAQRALVAKQVEDTTKLHVTGFIQKTHQRDVEKKAEMDKYPNPNIKR